MSVGGGGGGAGDGSGGGRETFLLVAGAQQAGKSSLVSQFLAPGKGAHGYGAVLTQPARVSR